MGEVEKGTGLSIVEKFVKSMSLLEVQRIRGGRNYTWVEERSVYE
jgi:hypothetical protein